MNLYSGFVKRNIGQLRESGANNNGRSQSNNQDMDAQMTKRFGANEQNKSIIPPRNPAQVIKISILCAGQMFGHEDVMNSRNYTTTIKCISNDAKVYCIKAE